MHIRMFIKKCRLARIDTKLLLYNCVVVLYDAPTMFTSTCCYRRRLMKVERGGDGGLNRCNFPAVVVDRCFGIYIIDRGFYLRACGRSVSISLFYNEKRR